MDKAKSYLIQIRELDRLINQLVSSAHRLRLKLTAIGNYANTDKVQTFGPKRSFEGTIVKIVDLEREIDQRIDELVDRKQEALIRIAKIPERNQQNVLIARYVNGRNWREIASELHFCTRQAHRIHNIALLSFVKENSDILKDVTQCHT